MTELIVEEKRSTTRYNDISTVYAWLSEPVTRTFDNGHESIIYTDRFTCFCDHYKVGQERDFIQQLHESEPNKYKRFVITWTDSN